MDRIPTGSGAVYKPSARLRGLVDCATETNSRTAPLSQQPACHHAERTIPLHTVSQHERKELANDAFPVDKTISTTPSRTGHGQVKYLFKPRTPGRTEKAKLHSFSTSTLDVGECSASHASRFNPEKETRPGRP